MAWIESHQALAGHPKTRRCARKLDVSIPTMVGHLHMLWWWAMDYAPDGELTKFEHDDIADAMQFDGDPDLLVRVLIDAKFIDQINDELQIHDWFDYAGRLLEKREQNNERKRRSREKKKKSEGSHAPVTRDGNVTDEGVTGLPNQHNQHNITEPNQPYQTEQQPTEPNSIDTVGSSRSEFETNPYRMFENEGFGTISSVIKDQLDDMIDTYGNRWVCEAMKKAVLAGKRKISYVEGILKNWNAEGIDDPWTKEQPKKRTGSQSKSGKPSIPITTNEPPPGTQVSDKEMAEMMEFARQMSGKPDA
ncbi:DnaD domain-containing protein [Paenibacillus sp. MDMC362]|uniref:DnaD domain-containing protein n=1 Tax=Paenibacillus sp. MDMC362 TaxID=2977365 RepID=UPI0015EC0A49|nr:DnaD domain protein [Paenibacillus sp. MDMC362]